MIIPTVNERLNEAELLKIIGDADGIICGDDRLTRKVLFAAKKLKVISKWGTGIDSIDRDAATELGIQRLQHAECVHAACCRFGLRDDAGVRAAGFPGRIDR